MRGRQFAAALVAAVCCAAAPVGIVRASAAADLVLSSPTAGPGTEVSVSGTGFSFPEPDTCAIVAFGTQWPCGLTAQGAQGELTLSKAEVGVGTHSIRVCVPSCTRPWAGEALGDLVVGNVPGLRRADVPSSPDTVPAVSVERGQVTGLRLAASTGAEVTVSPSFAWRNGRVTSPDSISITAPRLPTSRRPVGCALSWDGAEVGACEIDDDGRLTGALVVPAQAQPGVHVVRACRPGCAGPVVQQEARLTVPEVGTPTASATSPTATPSATRTATPTPTPTRTRTPTAGPTTADPTRSPPSPTASAQPVDVPRVLRLELDEARRVLEAVGLRVGEVTGSGRVVEQDPAADTPVPLDTPVDLELRPVDAPPAVEVPDLTGLTVPEAQERLGPSGLALDDPPSGGGVVESQIPTAGTSVDPGTLVQVALTAPASSTLRWILPLLLALAVLLAGAAAARVRWRSRSSERAAHAPSARLEPVPDPRPVVRTTTTVPAQRLPVLELLVRPDDHPTITTEVRS